MSEMFAKRFSFDVELDRAYKDADGNMHVIGVASDDEVDRTGDRMSRSCVESMAKQATTSRLPLLDNHRSTFEFGYSTLGTAKKKDGTGRTELIVDFQLDPAFPQSVKLFTEIANKTSKRQLSIGGFLNRSNPKAVELREENGKIVRVINDITLEHIAATRPGMAAVPRTAFVDALVKDIFGDETIEQTQTWVAKAAEAAEAPSSVDAPPTAEKSIGVSPVNIVINTSNPNGLDAEALAKAIASQLNPTAISSKSVPLNQNDKEAPVADEVNKQDDATAAQTDEQSAAAASAAAAEAKTDETQTEEKETDAAAEAAASTEAPVLSKEAQKGLEALEKIGNMFGNTAPEPVAEAPLPEEIQALAKAFAAVKELKMEEKSLEAVARIHGAMVALLQSEGIDDGQAEEAHKSAPAVDVDAITKSVTDAVIAALPAEVFVAKSDENLVVKHFDEAFNALTGAMAKSMTDMGKGFQGELEKAIAGVQAQVEKTNKENDERVSRLEKAGGVRQSAPASDSTVAKGGSANSREPDAGNPFRGVLDGVLSKAGVRVQ